MNLEETMKKMAILLAVTFVVGAHQQGVAQGKGKRYPKLAPFSAVRWKESTPEVKVKDVWYELLGHRRHGGQGGRQVLQGQGRKTLAKAL
jgi:hypothetical protein